jgi:hypothetical protein
MIFKFHIQYFSHICQCPVCSVEQIIFANVVLWLYPLSFEYSPERFGQIEMWGIGWQKKYKQPSVFPKFAMPHNFLGSMNLCVIKDNNSLLAHSKRQAIIIFLSENNLSEVFIRECFLSKSFSRHFTFFEKFTFSLLM